MIDRLVELLAALGAAVRVPIVVGAFGLAIGVAAFWATSFHDQQMFFGRVGTEQIVRMPGFDPITGQPYGLTYIWSDALMDPEVVTRELVVAPPPADMKRAIPMPVGTAVGVLVALLIRRLDRRLSRPQQPDVAAGRPAPS